MLNLKKTLTEILNHIDKNTYIVRTITGSTQVIDPNTNGYIGCNVSYVGYTPVGILGYNTRYNGGGSAQNYLFIWSIEISGTNAIVSVRNLGSNQATVTPLFTILYKKN